jgi:hypothetical protein
MVNARQNLPGAGRKLPLEALALAAVTLFLLHFIWLAAWPAAC